MESNETRGPVKGRILNSTPLDFWRGGKIEQARNEQHSQSFPDDFFPVHKVGDKFELEQVDDCQNAKLEALRGMSEQKAPLVMFLVAPASCERYERVRYRVALLHLIATQRAKLLAESGEAVAQVFMSRDARKTLAEQLSPVLAVVRGAQPRHVPNMILGIDGIDQYLLSSLEAANLIKEIASCGVSVVCGTDPRHTEGRSLMLALRSVGVAVARERVPPLPKRSSQKPSGAKKVKERFIATGSASSSSAGLLRVQALSQPLRSTVNSRVGSAGLLRAPRPRKSSYSGQIESVGQPSEHVQSMSEEAGKFAVVASD
ncbi:hypothetical protein [Paraburkholderia fungorum]|jgi:hypothetical protein|uniref:hypothetical protein n=1 Tax=Paraburkholderia fungorum TaxID=134537 RepID=UPI00387801B0